MRHLTGPAKWMRLARTALAGAPGARLPLAALVSQAVMMRDAKLTELDGRTFVKAVDPPLGSRAYRAAAEGLDAISRGEHRLLTLCISPTMRCPMRCFYCYGRNHPPGDEMSTERLKRLIREAQDLGAYSIHYSGGEPLVRDDLAEIIASTDERSCSLLMTSGYGFPAKSRDLRDAGLEVVEVSLDTFDEAEFNRRRGHPDAFRIAVDAVQAALAEGFYVVLGMVVDEAMLAPGAFDRYVRRAADLGVHEIRIYAPRPSAALGRHAFRGLSRAQLAEVSTFPRRYNRMPDVPTVSSIDHAELPGNYGCTGGTVFAHVSAAGELTPCTMSPVSFGNVRERPLAEVYASMRAQYAHPLRRCPLPAVWQLIRDVPDGALPVRDEAIVRRVTEALRRANPSPPEFWRRLATKPREHNP